MAYDFDIDFVVLWVDGSDPAWIQEYNEYAPKSEQLGIDSSTTRYRDYGLLRYWFRGVEKFAPWVRKVHFVTCGQKPDWLDETNPKLHLVSHKDYIPEKFLPLFNASAIEDSLHKIPSLSEHFVYFNDDIFLTSPCPRSLYFNPHGLPQGSAIQNIIACDGASVMMSIAANDLHQLNLHFDKHKLMKVHPWLWFHPSYGISNIAKNIVLGKWKKFVGFINPHFSQPYLKSSLEDCWNHCGEKLLETVSHRYRSMGDVNQWLFRYWQLCLGKFSPCAPYKYQKYYELGVDSTPSICESIKRQRFKSICINDGQDSHFEESKKMLQESFQKIIPERCSFEKEDAR